MLAFDPRYKRAVVQTLMSLVMNCTTTQQPGLG